MEFRDRVANKPNRVRLTYEEGGASVYATVELADEPIDEGTPLNALNMNKLLNKENNDYIIEQGGIGIWTYEKWKSGIFKCWCVKKYSCDVDGGGFVYAPLEITFPIAFSSFPNVQATSSGQLGFNHIISSADWDKQKISGVRVFSTQSVTVTGSLFVQVIGKWK